MNRVFRILGFSIIFLVFYTIFSKIFIINECKYLPNDGQRKIKGFYKEKSNTLDVIFFGSSATYTCVNPNIIWNEYGIPSYCFSGSEQTMDISYFFMKESLKYQKPKVIVLDIFYCYYSSYYARDFVRTLSIVYFKPSINKYNMIIECTQPISKYGIFHSSTYYNKEKWKSLSRGDFDFDDTFMDGYCFKGYSPMTKISESEEIIENNKTKSKLHYKVEKYLMNIINLSKKEGIKLLLVNNPKTRRVSVDYPMYNTVDSIAKSNQILYVDFNDIKYKDIINIDHKNDFESSAHLNYWGATKFSKYLGKYLQETYNLEDKRNNPEYRSWNENYKKYQEEINKIIDKDGEVK